ncbi:hypothetical protein BN172_5910056 [Clostridioides difficile T15]|nr:hypothetical protein BN172_5910056 [Clostridioides difficile T15]
MMSSIIFKSLINGGMSYENKENNFRIR